ncbi:hypothetical protein Tco_0000638 [Tanacetum coccineum]
MASTSNRHGKAKTSQRWTTAEEITLCTAWCNAMDKEERSLNNNSFLGEYECSSLALDRDERRDGKKRLNHLKQDQTMLVIKRFSERKKVFRERKKTGKIRAKRGKRMRLVKHGLEECEFENTYNNDKNLSEIQLEHEREDELVMVVVKVVHEYYRMVVKEIEDGLLKEIEIDGENEDDNENKLVMVNEEGWMS